MQNVEIQKWDKSNFPVSAIQEASDNDLLYDRFGMANRDDADLAYSILEFGIQEPLTLSADGVLLSGHRRLAAAKYWRMETVPVRVLDDVVFNALSGAKRLEVLRRHNQQREKSPGERIREKLLGIDPAVAHRELKRKRIDTLQLKGATEANVKLGAVKKRAAITTIQFLTKVKEVIKANRDYWPLTVRRVHYLLLNDPPLRHDKKPDSVYVNDKTSYKALTNLLIRARLNHDVPMEAIEDSTRPIRLGGGFSTFEQFVARETDGFLIGYHRNLMQGQQHHVEIMLEKNALRTVIESVAREYCIPCTTGKGFSSLSPRYELAMRFEQSGKERLVLLMLTDFDPDGDEIAASFARSLRDDFGIKNIHPVKVALTAEQVQAYDLPSDMDAKISSPNYQKFLKKYGSTKVVELDAAPVVLLQTKLREAIESVIDMAEFNAQVEQERQDAAHIEAHRQIVFEAIKGKMVI
ncbi:MAG: ParB/RepB/Spo0J family partition protein [Pseudomonas sp.]|nr:ParB/RepB/Spo0J family partition protein [Pseudomonas sp.]